MSEDTQVPFTPPPKLEIAFEVLEHNRREIDKITGLYLTRRARIPEDDRRAQRHLYSDFRAAEAALREYQQRLMEKISAYWLAQPITPDPVRVTITGKDNSGKPIKETVTLKGTEGVTTELAFSVWQALRK